MLNTSSSKAGKYLLSLLKKCCLPLLQISVYLLLFISGVHAQVDPNEYPPGHPNVSVSALDQLRSFPLPRYKTGHTMLQNFNWMDPVYFGGRFQSGVSDAQAITNSVEIQSELAKNYNYYVNVSWSVDNFNTAWKNLANSHPEYKVGLLTFRAQTATKLWDQTLPSSNYLQNSSGQFIDMNGSVTSNKNWRPTAPVSDYTADGQKVRGWLTSALSGLNRNVDLVNEDGEVFNLITPTAMAKDPVVTAAKNSSGLDWENYLGKQVRENETQAYRDQFMNLPLLQNAKYTLYRMDGQRQWNFRWEQIRNINSQIKGQYYSTSDFYVRWPNNWKDWSGPWHGLKWMTQSRHFEIAAGDKLFSPFVAAGYDADPEKDVRPAQWLGLLKLLGIYGAEYYYTGYFNEQGNYNPPNPPPYNPNGYAWQAVIPAYSQAITSRYEDILRNGSLLPGDMTDNSNSTGPIPYYQFNTGTSNKVVAIRKKDNANVYVITGTIQNSTNVINSTPLTGEVSITLNGQNLKFNIRRQGSTYIYDNTTPSAPVFYQLDEWHEASHPYRWTKDFNLEAELFDNANTNAVIKTSVPSGTGAGDFRSATTYVGFNTVGELQYNIQPRGTTTSNYYLWVRARSKDGSSTGFTTTLDGGTAQQFDCITSNAWTWYRFNVSNQAVTYTTLSLANHLLKIMPSNTKLEIEKISITTNSSAVYGTTASPCSGSSATITANGPTTFCQGGNVILTANTGTGYLWSNGATTKSITVSTSGTYTVTVTNGTPATSSPVTVNVSALPSAVITPSGPLTIIQGGSVTLTAGGGISYLWSPGNQTSQSITVSAAGSYTVRVSNSNGCSSVSAAAVVTVSGGGGTLNVTISANGPLSFCTGGSVNLTASTGSTYLWSTGQTTKTITVTNSGNYTVMVTAGTQSGTSSPVTVTAKPLPTAVITPSGPLTITQGNSVTLTSSNGNNYLWSPGNQSAKSITTSVAGSYTVRVTKSNGCSKTSAPVVVTVNGSSSCSYPTGLYATNVGSNSATLHWNAIAVDSLQIKLENITYGYPYTTSMFRGSFTQINVGSQPGSAYRWYIRSKCGSTLSNWSPFATYTTAGLKMASGDEDNGFTSKDASLKVFPNPTGGTVNVSFQSKTAGLAKIKFIDYTGKPVLEKEVEASGGLNELFFDLRNYPKGIYLLLLTVNETDFSKKVIVN